MKLFPRKPKYPEVKTAIVNLKSGTAFRGVIYRHGSEFMVLKNAEILADRGKNVEPAKKLDGDTMVLLDEIDFVQVL